jgi:BioD-like phosphotransacetylase family protein
MKKAEENKQKVEDLKQELDQRKEILDGVIKNIKNEENTDPEKKAKILKRIEKNKNFMEKVSNILEKNKTKKEKTE